MVAEGPELREDMTWSQAEPMLCARAWWFFFSVKRQIVDVLGFAP